MKFQEAVERLTSDIRALYMYRTSWKNFSPQSIVFEKNYNRLNYAQVPSNQGYSPTLNCILANDWDVKYEDNKSTDQVKIEAIFDAAFCAVESFIGGPGDFSAPNCTCDKCIAAGRAFKFTTGTYRIDQFTFEYLWNLFIQLENTKQYKFGIEYYEPKKCRITLQPSRCIICVEANKPEIRIGKYIYSLEAKTFRGLDHAKV